MDSPVIGAVLRETRRRKGRIVAIAPTDSNVAKHLMTAGLGLIMTVVQSEVAAIHAAKLIAVAQQTV